MVGVDLRLPEVDLGSRPALYGRLGACSLGKVKIIAQVETMSQIGGRSLGAHTLWEIVVELVGLELFVGY